MQTMQKLLLPIQQIRVLELNYHHINIELKQELREVLKLVQT